MATETKTAICDRYEARGDENSNWELVVEFEVEDNRVDIYEFFGNGQTMMSYHGRTVVLHRGKCNAANVDALVDALESEKAQGLLGEAVEGYSCEWNGNNHVGRYTEDAEKAIEELVGIVNDAIESLPGLWKAAEWFGGAAIRREAVLGEINEGETLKQAAGRAVKDALPDYHLCAKDVEQYFHNELKDAFDDGEFCAEISELVKILLEG